MFLKYCFLLYLQLQIIQLSCTTFPSDFPILSNNTIPEPCKQFEVTFSRYYCLTDTNVIRSWYLNMTGMIQYNALYDAVNTRIHQIQITPNSTEVIFFQVNTCFVYCLSALTLVQTNKYTTNTYCPTPLKGAIKTQPDELITIYPSSPYHQIYRYNITSGWSYGPYNSEQAKIDQATSLRVMINKNKTAIVVWNDFGSYDMFFFNGSYLQGAAPSGYDLMNQGNFNLTTKTNPKFSADGNKLIIEDDNLNYFRVQSIANLYQGKYVNYLNKTMMPYVIQATEFWGSYAIIALFHDTKITYVTDYGDFINQVDYGYSWSRFTFLMYLDRKLVQCIGNTIIIRSIACPPNSTFTSAISLACTDPPPTVPPQPSPSNANTTNNTSNTANSTTNTSGNSTNNTTTNSTTNNLTTNNSLSSNTTNPTNHTTPQTINNTNLPSPNTVFPTDPSHSFPFEIISFLKPFTLENQALVILNRVPASRLLFRPIFIFFGNFDDLQLYNYMDVFFNPVMRDFFRCIQQLEEQKWEIIHFYAVWQNWLRINVDDWRSYLNSTLRLNYTSPRFLQIENQANGFILNTLEFYLSNVILVFLVFLAGHILFRIAKALSLSIKPMISKFKVWLAFPIVFMDGNVQYMSYLMGFEIDNLWFVSFKGKLQAGCVMGWLFLFVFGVSTIYFLLKYFYEKSCSRYYENCHSDVQGVFYMSLLYGIRNITLGVAHQILPEGSMLIFTKLAALMAIEAIFLAMMIHLIMKRFFNSKLRQWITIFTAVLRIFLVTMFTVDVAISKSHEFVLGDIYSISLSIYLILWLCMSFHEVGMVLLEMSNFCYVKIMKVSQGTITPVKIKLQKKKAKEIIRIQMIEEQPLQNEVQTSLQPFVQTIKYEEKRLDLIDQIKPRNSKSLQKGSNTNITHLGMMNPPDVKRKDSIELNANIQFVEKNQTIVHANITRSLFRTSQIKNS